MSKRFGSPPEEHRKRAFASTKLMRQHAQTFRRALKKKHCAQALSSLLWVEHWKATQEAETRGADYHRGGRGQASLSIRMMGNRFAKRCLVNTKAY